MVTWFSHVIYHPAENGCRENQRIPKMEKHKSKKEFQWTDDESELLLSVTIDYKTAKAIENVDWESVKSKYNDIYARFKAYLPDSPPTQSEKESINCGLMRVPSYKRRSNQTNCNY